jgi:hypothetical protein
MPRSVSLVGLAQRGVIPQKQFYIRMFVYDPVVLEGAVAAAYHSPQSVDLLRTSFQ